MYYIFIIMNFINSTLFLFMKHPLAMGLTLLLQTLMICLISGIFLKSFWFSYILFLVFLGGLLVLFIYVTSLASNEMFNFSFKIFLNLIFTFLIFWFIYFFLDKILFMNNMINLENENLSILKSFSQENSFILNKLYNSPTNFITIMMMIYLFLTLIAIVKITNVFEGPLRPKIN